MSNLPREQILKSLTPHFEMKTEKFGTIKVKNMSVGAISELVKKLPDYKDRSGREIAFACIPIISELEDETQIDASQLSEPELNELADKYLANTSTPNKTDSEENPIMKVNREECESSINYMGRVIAAEITDFNDSMIKVLDRSGILNASRQIDTLASMVDKTSALSSIKGLHTATDKLRSALQNVERFKIYESPAMQTIKELQKQGELYESVVPSYVRDVQKMHDVMKDFTLPHWREELINSSAEIRPQPVPRIKVEEFMLPPNPIHKTNEKLNELNERMDAFTETLAGHLEASAIAIQEVASEIKTGSKGTSKQNWWVIGIAALSLVVAVVGFFKDSFKSPPSVANQSATTTTPATIKPAPVILPASVRPDTVVKSAEPVNPTIPAKQTFNPKSDPRGAGLDNTRQK